MVTKAKQSSDEPTVTRITASDTPTKTAKKAPSEKVSAVKTDITNANKTEKKPAKRGFWKSLALPFVASGRYFKGAWVELRLVRWPNRRSTWSMTFAVLLYSIFFVILVLVLDGIFKWLFDLVIGK